MALAGVSWGPDLVEFVSEGPDLVEFEQDSGHWLV